MKDSHSHEVRFLAENAPESIPTLGSSQCYPDPIAGFRGQGTPVAKGLEKWRERSRGKTGMEKEGSGMKRWEGRRKEEGFHTGTPFFLLQALLIPEVLYLTQEEEEDLRGNQRTPGSSAKTAIKWK